MSLINLLKRSFKSNESIKEESSLNITKENVKNNQNINLSIEPMQECAKHEFILHESTEKTDKDIVYTGKWKAKDMKFVQLWNNDLYEPLKRNYTIRTMIYWTPDYRSIGDEYGGSDNRCHESICLTVNIEEGLVFFEDYARAARIFESKIEAETFIQEARKKFNNELDMGKGTDFIYGWGGCMASLMKYNNPNIEYIPIIFPDNEKFRIPRYKEKVEWDLIGKGAIMVIPKEGKKYLAVIQRKNKPRDLRPFLRYIAQN